METGFSKKQVMTAVKALMDEGIDNVDNQSFVILLWLKEKISGASND